MNKLIQVEIAFASIDKQKIIGIEINSGSTVEMAIRQSGILKMFPEIDLSVHKVGVFSKLCKLSDEVFEGDRIEIYRSLQIDPKEGRRLKAKKSRA